MNSRRKLIIGAVALVVVTFLLTAGGALYLFSQVVPDTTGAVKLMRAMDVVRTRYIEPVSTETLMNGAIQGMVKSLNDPYSIYMDAKMYRDFRMETEGSFSGVGIVISVKDKQLTDGPVAAFHAQLHAPAAPPPPSHVGEAVAALLGLGVAEVNARRVVEQAALRLGEDADIPALIKAGLQELGR